MFYLELLITMKFTFERVLYADEIKEVTLISVCSASIWSMSFVNVVLLPIFLKYTFNSHLQCTKNVVPVFFP